MYTGQLIQASKDLISTDEATHGVTPGGVNPITLEGFYSFWSAVYFFFSVFFDNFVRC